ncbi:MAG TPA: YqiA/YcfP family alpha/beta fold hydrolase [Vicinamibacterales bacterium]|nr:YqiA/YcfP family alpha/beta fold hydrolase [Vicinamibacterales bacterium]
MPAIYLHGFASSAQSTKATFFRTRLAEIGVSLAVPDFNEPEFETLTITRMAAQVSDLLDSPAVLIGSSLGGFVALHVAVSHPARVPALVLLAPALNFGPDAAGTGTAGAAAPGGTAGRGRRVQLGDRSLEEWRRTDALEVMHYGFGRVMPVRYALYEDAGRYDAFATRPSMPVQIFQGLRDTAVDPAMVQRWAADRPNVELHLLDDDHQLAGSLEYIWEHARRFFDA